MNDFNRRCRLPPPYASYTSYSHPPENDPPFSDWKVPNIGEQSSGPQANFEAAPTVAENHSRVNQGEWSLNTKVAIPRKRATTSSRDWRSSRRVGQACESCREQKAKCSGHRPTCRRCQEAGIRCSYGGRKREKVAKCVNCYSTD